MVRGWEVSLEESMEGIDLKQARSIINKPIPKVPKGLPGPDKNGNPPVTIMLFYQYKEPHWTPKEHKAAIRFCMELGRTHKVTGRGRVAQEGLNCTLTGTAEGVRAFAQGLREWDKDFEECDFKLTDGLDWTKRFRTLTLLKKDELVAYGLPVESAPQLKDNNTIHVEADEYHKMMSQKNTVIIDVRNFYESNIGHFQPPPGGAEFIDPKVRNSHELPKWLGTSEVQEKLKGKKVMMYCTGGIRCERFSALLSQMKKENPEFQTEGEYMVRGGIERYMRTFPEGGFWKGRNYLFDKRQEQVPENKPKEELEAEVESYCCICRTPWGIYRGKNKCSGEECGVPIIVCPGCTEAAEAADPEKLRCPLCEEGRNLRNLATPNFSRREAYREAEKRKAANMNGADSAKALKRAKHSARDPSDRLFVGNLPLVINATQIKEALGAGVEMIHWIKDRNTDLWYGSTFVQMSSEDKATKVVKLAKEGNGIKMGKRRLRVNFAPYGDSDAWPPAGHKHSERPPVPSGAVLFVPRVFNPKEPKESKEAKEAKAPKKPKAPKDAEESEE